MELQNVIFTNLNAVCNLGGHYRHAPDARWTHERHKFSQNKFYFITEGRCRIKIDEDDYVAEAGDWFLIPANTFHGYSSFEGESFRKYWMHFDVYPNTELFNLLNLPHIVKVPEKSGAYSLFSQFEKVHASDLLSNKIKEKAILLNLIAEYISLACPGGASIKSDSDMRVYDILRYINTNLDKPLTNEELSARFYMHPNQLIRLFKKKTGITPGRYVALKKMETAKRMLEDTDLRIVEIMEKIGQNDMSGFSKQFKKFYNQSPREYRKLFAETKK